VRRARRADANQPAIVAALRAAGRTVEVISDVGRGVPDLLVGHLGRTFLLELKSPGGKMTPPETAWHLAWRGHAAVVFTAQEAIEATR
jgi:hypothetical protein